MRLSKVASCAIVGVLAMNFIGCGGNNSNTTKNNNTTIKQAKGTVSDGPIGNARVFIDKNFNGRWDTGEPFNITSDDNKTRGKFSMNYVASGDKVIMIAEDYNGSATDPIDHSGDKFKFYMISDGSNDSYDVNPKNMAKFLTSRGLGEKVIADLKKSGLKMKSDFNLSDTNQTEIFEQLSKKDRKLVIKSIIKKILQNNYQFESNKAIFSNAKKELNLDNKTDISFVEVNTTKENDVNISEVSNFLLNKATPNVIPVGNDIAITVAKDLIPASENNTSDISYGIDNMTADNSQSPVILKRAIFSGISSMNDKIHAILSSSFTSGSKTLYITPYNSVLEIPKYHSLVKMGYKPLLATDITVRNSKGTKLSLTDLSSMQGVIEDHRADAVDANSADLKYLYFNGNKWIDNNISVGTAANGFANLQLAPYVIAQKVANKKLYKDVNITIVNANILKGALVVAKGPASSISPAVQGRILARADNNTSIPLDYQKISDENITFKIPSDLNITDIVILDKNLNKIGNDAVVSLPVTNNQANITDKVENIAIGAEKDKIGSIIKPFILNDFDDSHSTYNDIKKLSIPWWVDNNNTIKNDFFTVVKNCLIDGNCTDINNTISSTSWTNNSSYTNDKNVIQTEKYTYMVNVDPKANTVKFTKEYTEQDKKETFAKTYTFKPYNIKLIKNDNDENANITYTNIDRNNTINIVANSSGSYNGYSDSEDSSNYTETWNINVLGHFKTLKELDPNAGLAYDGNLTYEITGYDNVDDNGKIEKYNGYVKIINHDIAKAKGKYYIKDSDENASGTYVNDGTNFIITK